jgi:hypothetical protein
MGCDNKNRPKGGAIAQVASASRAGPTRPGVEQYIPVAKERHTGERHGLPSHVCASGSLAAFVLVVGDLHVRAQLLAACQPD